jgi:ABC-2 type transport system permease protein
MIWFKTWSESRQRLLLTSAAIILVVAWAILNADEAMRRFDRKPPITFTQYVWYVYASRLQLVWTISAFFLGLGGLLRERALGTAHYTLSLPVTRRQWMNVRTVIGVCQATVLAVIPAILIPIGARVIGRSYPPLEALKFSILLATAGLVFFCLGLFYSALLEGEFTSIVVGLLTIYLIFTAQDYLYRWLPYFSVQGLLSGADVVDRTTGFLSTFPWTGMLKSFAAAVLLYSAAREITVYRDF